MKRLRIKPVRRYDIPRYPQGIYRKPDRNQLHDIASMGAISALLLTTLGCEVPFIEDIFGNGGIAGMMGDPKPPTEAEARLAILTAFAEYGIMLEQEQEVLLTFIDGASSRVNLDGWNDSLRVGYEYMGGADIPPDTADAVFWQRRDDIDSLSRTADGPHIGLFDVPYSSSPEQGEEILMALAREMLDSLRAQGHI